MFWHILRLSVTRLHLVCFFESGDLKRTLTLENVFVQTRNTKETKINFSKKNCLKRRFQVRAANLGLFQENLLLIVIQELKGNSIFAQ